MTHTEYVLLPEYDAAILQTLPKQGSKIGFKPLAKQVKAVAAELSEQVGEKITGASVGGRMRILAQHGFVVGVPVQPVGTGLGYQITPDGEAYVRENGGA